MGQAPVRSGANRIGLGAFTEVAVTAGMLAFVGYFLLSIQGLRFQARIFPTVVLSVCAVLLLITLVTATVKLARRAPETAPAGAEQTEELAPVYRSFLVPVVLIGASFAIKHLGFYIAVPIVAGLLFWIAGCRPWWLAAVLALPTTALVWLIFDLLVGVSLPR